MYEIVETASEVKWNGTKVKPIITLKDKYAYAHIVMDDGCYVLLIYKDGDSYKPTSWWFPEAIEAVQLHNQG